jgi:hypothetical protein
MPRLPLFLAAALGLVACAPAPAEAPAPQPEVVARWDHRAEADEWNAAALRALHGPGAPMLALNPRDAADFCPAYGSADAEGRAAFWVAFMSGLARYESGYRPEAAGAGGRYQGLLQISPATARFHGCELASSRGLYDGATNLACAVRIATRAVVRDGVVATGRGGMAADWPPLRDPAKRTEIAAFTRQIPACRG